MPSIQSRSITQFHLTSWPDHDVPESASPLMKFHKLVMSAVDKQSGPLLVHCSAGVGRTGTFITVDIALEQAEKERKVDIAGIVTRLRQQRMKMVQNQVIKHINLIEIFQLRSPCAIIRLSICLYIKQF